jgi:hypothetical protein
MKTYKELMEEINENHIKQSEHKHRLIHTISTKQDSGQLIHRNTKEKETDTHYETHFDSNYASGLVSRVHKKTGKVERNFHVHSIPRKLGPAIQHYKKNPNGEFK